MAGRAIDFLDLAHILSKSNLRELLLPRNLKPKHSQRTIAREHHNSDYYSKSQRQLVQSNGGREFEHRCVRSNWSSCQGMRPRSPPYQQKFRQNFANGP